MTVTATTPPPEIRVANTEIRLTADSASTLNIPLNLIEAIANIPANEINAMNNLANSLFFTGTWWVGSPTNIWGIDPADPPKIQALAEIFAPFPAVSKPLAEQLTILLAAELPVNAACGATTCPPFVPLQPITGIPPIDQIIHWALILTGLEPFPLLNNAFRVPLATLMSGYTFGPVTDPAGPVAPGYGYPGTTGPDNQMPWANTTAKLDPFAPITSFITSLMEPPTGIKIASPEEVITAFTNLFKALWVGFYPFVPGSPVCLQCTTTPLPPDWYPDPPGLSMLGAPATSMPSATTDSARTFTIDVATTAPREDVQSNVVAGDEAEIADAMSETPGSEVGASDVGHGAYDSITTVEEPTQTSTSSTDTTRDGNKVEPVRSGGRQARPDGVLHPVGDQIRSAISNLTDGLKGGSTETGKAETDAANSGAAGH
jgi:hypothetical protein